MGGSASCGRPEEPVVTTTEASRTAFDGRPVVILCSTGVTGKIQPLRLAACLQYKRCELQFVRVMPQRQKEWIPEPPNSASRLPAVVIPDRPQGSLVFGIPEICRYVEDLYPEPRLYPEDHASLQLLHEYEQRLEFSYYLTGKRLISGPPEVLRKYLDNMGQSVGGYTACCTRTCLTICACDCVMRNMSQNLQKDELAKILNTGRTDIYEKMKHMTYEGAAEAMIGEISYWNEVLGKACEAKPKLEYLCTQDHPTTADFYLYVLLQVFLNGYEGISGPLAGEEVKDLKEWPHLKHWWTEMMQKFGGPGCNEEKWVWAPSHPLNSRGENAAAMLEGRVTAHVHGVYEVDEG